MSDVTLVCGSRTWTNGALIERVLATLPPDTIIVHGAARGADTLADLAAERLGLQRRPYPADWARHGRGAGPKRNQAMLDAEHPARALAFRMPGPSPGTDDMLRRCRAAGVPITLYTPEDLGGDPTMPRFVSFKTPQGGQIVVNPDHVILFRPVPGEGQATCEMALVGINDDVQVLGTLREVGLRLQPQPDPLGRAP